MSHYPSPRRAFTALACCVLLSCSEEPDEPVLVDAGSPITASGDAAAPRDAAGPATPRADAATSTTPEDAGTEEDDDDEGDDDDDDVIDSGVKGGSDAGKKDAGSTKADAGTKRDGGTKPADGGTKPADSGTEPADSGAPEVVDSGAPVVVDSGAPVVVDSGAPVVADSGAPVVVDSGAPVVVDSGAPVVVDSGAPVVVDSGMPSSGGFLHSAECKACAELNCASYLGTEPTIANCSDSLCQEIVACAEKNKCIEGPLSVNNCYCGNVPTFDECAAVTYVPNGPCKSLYEQGFMSTDKDFVLEHSIDQAFAGGNANYVLTCMADLCVPECLM